MRESTKHGPRLDDELARETRPLEQGAPIEPRAREDLEKEDADLEYDETHLLRALESDPVSARRELSRHLRPSAFPANSEGLAAEAENRQAPEAVVGLLRALPPGRTFATVHEVWAALQGFDDVRGAAAHEPLTEGDR